MSSFLTKTYEAQTPKVANYYRGGTDNLVFTPMASCTVIEYSKVNIAAKNREKPDGKQF